MIIQRWLLAPLMYIYRTYLLRLISFLPLTLSTSLILPIPTTLPRHLLWDRRPERWKARHRVDYGSETKALTRRAGIISGTGVQQWTVPAILHLNLPFTLLAHGPIIDWPWADIGRSQLKSRWFWLWPGMDAKYISYKKIIVDNGRIAHWHIILVFSPS